MEGLERHWQRAAARGARAFGFAGATVLGLTVPGCALLPQPWGGGADSIVGRVMLPFFFVLLIVQLACGLVAGHRPARALLLAALALWGIGSLQYSEAAADNLVGGAAPGVPFYLVAYILITVYLLTDLPGRGKPSLATWVDALIVAGGTASLAGSALLLTSNYGSITEDASRMVALLYPMLDLLLAALVLAQACTGMRPYGPMTRALAGAFCFLAIADAALSQGIFQSDYNRRPVIDVACGVGLWLLVWAACRARRPEAGPMNAHWLTRLPVALSIGWSFLGLGAAITSPPMIDTSYVLIPAVLTLVAGQARMWLAIRDARGASEARALSLTDELTGLPNRRALTNRLAAMLAEDRPLALMMLDLDGFKEINDGLGHTAGDLLLRRVAQRVRTALPEEVLVVRLGGDEFAMAVPTSDEKRLMTLAQVVLEAIGGAYELDGVALSIEGSIGITVRCDEDDEATDLLRRADVAMYQAKAERSGAVLYDRSRDEFSRDRLKLADALRRAISTEQIEMWYQPQVDARTGEVCGLEALVRWRHPTEGLIPPGEFLPSARRAGLMLPLSMKVVELVVEDIRRWTCEQHADAQLPAVPPVAINVAPPELLGKALVPILLSHLEENRLGSDAVVLEVTEDSFLSEPARAREVLESLHAHGVLVSIDDYGTGYSSLAYLRDLPVQELKIDRSFVSMMDTDERSREIVASTAGLARALSMRVVAEGVEDAATMHRLAEIGVDVLQGYYLARPMPFAEVTPWREAWHLSGQAQYLGGGHGSSPASSAGPPVLVPRQVGVTATLSR
jgi:diguanylate cyclase (GGDEF)-like protein